MGQELCWRSRCWNAVVAGLLLGFCLVRAEHGSFWRFFGWRFSLFAGVHIGPDVLPRIRGHYMPCPALSPAAWMAVQECVDVVFFKAICRSYFWLVSVCVLLVFAGWGL
jgi:hypothetical protein